MPDHQEGGGEPVLCSAWSQQLDEPTAGTAPVARTWLAVEQPGPWGRAALEQSHLDPALGQAVDLRSAGSGTKVVLVRRPGRHPDDHVVHRREVLVAHTGPGRTWMRRTWVEDPAVLLDLDLAALGRGDLRALAPLGPAEAVEPVEGPVLLVCTNGRRDRCCAIFGRPLAAGLARDPRWGDRVLEVTHLGGHRFSPTAVLLPWGLAYGRLDEVAAQAVLAGAGQGRMALAGLRGRSTWDRAGQAAEAAVREAAGLTGLDDVVSVRRLPDLSGEHGDRPVREVEAGDGRRWQVALDVVAAEPPRPESCGKAPARPEHFLAAAPRPV